MDALPRLLLLHNSGHLIVIEGHTQIGRGRGERRPPLRVWHTDRPMPPDFADLELVIHVDGSPYMSRNHAGIRREGRGYTVQDLNSLNGTFHNGSRIPPGTHHPLCDGDVLAMGPDEFRVACAPERLALDTPEGRVAFSVLLSPEWYLGVAGFGHDDHALRTFYTSVARVAGELHQRGYQTQVHGVRVGWTPQVYGPTVAVVERATVLNALQLRGYAAGAEAHTFFQFSGHGVREGLVLNRSELLTPDMLFEVVAAIRGKKFLLLDACHAGVFLADKRRIPPRTAVLAATRTAQSQAFGDGAHVSAAGIELPMTVLSRRLWSLLHDHHRSFNILSERGTLERAFQHEDSGIVYVQKPAMHSASYTVCVKSAVFERLSTLDIDAIVRQQRVHG